jgi:predicted RNA-binding protein with EMAP domain
MNEQTKLILALMQIENVRNLLQGGQYAGFFTSHLLPIKFEIERQLANLTNTERYTKIKE